MAIKHINENAKEESGVLLSGNDAIKEYRDSSNPSL